jgi:hypothetical protein
MPLTIELTLNAIKIVHTFVWAAFVSCILAIWLFAWQAEFYYATLSIGIVCVGWPLAGSHSGGNPWYMGPARRGSGPGASQPHAGAVSSNV